MGATLARIASLRRTGVVGNSRRLIDRLPPMLTAESHVVNPIPLLPRRRRRAVRDAHGEQALCIAMEPAVVDRLSRATTDSLNAGNRLAVALMLEIPHAPRRKAMHVRWQHGNRRPRVSRINLPSG